MNFGDRWDCHRSKLRGGYHDNKHLQNAWNKYGEDNFEFAVVHRLKDGEDINQLEISYIHEYKENGLAYNIGDGGDGGNLLGKHLSEETKRKIGEKNRKNMLGKKCSDETRKKMSGSQKKRYANWTDEERAKFSKTVSEKCRGYKLSEEFRRNLSEEQKIKPRSAKYSIETVHEIRRLYECDGLTFREISEKLKIPISTVKSIALYKRWKYA